MTTFDLDNRLQSLGWCATFAAKFGFLSLWMMLADSVSNKMKLDQRTTRLMPYPEALGDTEKFATKYFYTGCQFYAAILSVMDPTLSFLCVFAMEMAAFGMTLCRKGILTPRGWHRLYFISLWVVYLVVITTKTSSSVFVACICGFTARELRLRLKLNKYMLWGLILLGAELTRTFLGTLSDDISTVSSFQMLSKALFGYGALSTLVDCRWCLTNGHGEVKNK